MSRQKINTIMVSHWLGVGLVLTTIFLCRSGAEPVPLRDRRLAELSFPGGTLRQFVDAINNGVGVANDDGTPMVVIDDGLPQVVNWAGHADELLVERMMSDVNSWFANSLATMDDDGHDFRISAVSVRNIALSDMMAVAESLSDKRVTWQRDRVTLHLYPHFLAIVEHRILQPSMFRTIDFHEHIYLSQRNFGMNFIVARPAQSQAYVLEEPARHIRAVRENLLIGVRPMVVTMVGYDGPDYIRQATLLDGIEDAEPLAYAPVLSGQAALTIDEALSAWQIVRHHAHRRRVLETIRELVDQAEDVPEHANAVKREYWRISDLIWFRKFKLEYDLEERAAELRIIYARLAEYGKENEGMIPSDLMAKVELPDEVDATAYRILEVPSIDGMTQGVALCINERLWMMDGLEVNEVYAVPPEVGRDSFNIPYGRHIRMPYGQYLDRRAAGEQLELEGKYEFFYDPRVVVLMGDGLVRTVGKKDFAVLLEEDAATRARLGLPPAPEGLSEKYFGMVDDRFKEYTIMADPFGPD